MIFMCILQAATICMSVHRDVSDGDCGSWPCCVWSSQHHRVCTCWQRLDLQPHLGTPDHCTEMKDFPTYCLFSIRRASASSLVLFVFRGTVLEVPWTQLLSSSVRRLTVACCLWSLSTKWRKTANSLWALDTGWNRWVHQNTHTEI